MNVDLHTTRIQKILLSFRRGWLGEYINPLRDWTAGLSVAALLFLSGVVYTAFDFYTQFGAPDETVTVGESTLVYREKEVKYYAELFAERDRTFNELRKSRHYVLPAVIVPATTTEERLADEGAGE